MALHGAGMMRNLGRGRSAGLRRYHATFRRSGLLLQRQTLPGMGTAGPRVRALVTMAALTGLAGLAIAILPARLAGATTQTVTNCGDSGAGSLRQAVLNAASGDTITFALSPACSLITLDTIHFGSMTISKNLTITGPGASALAVSGGNATTVFVINQLVNAAISGLTIENGRSNDSLYGGGIDNEGILTVTDTTLRDNIGGGISNAGTLTVSNSTLSGNSAVVGGGIDNGGTLTVTNTILSGNSAQQYGGGIYNEANATDAGGASVTGSTLTSNTAVLDGGGGIYNGSGGTMAVTDSTLFGNSAFGGGGGIYNDHADSFNLTSSTLEANSAYSQGGGIYNDGTFAVTDSTLSGNLVNNGGGGGIFNQGGVTTVTHGTLSGNRAFTVGGGIDNFSGSTTLVATIVANSGTGLDCAGNSAPLVTNGGYNLDDDGACGFSGTSLSHTLAGLDPGGLKSNGGPTQTIALEPGSPAIDHTTNSTLCTGSDQRGTMRTTPCDIGAYQTTPTTTTTTTTTTTGPTTTTTTPIPAPTTSPAFAQGYDLVAADGGIFNFGTAQFDGSMGGSYLERAGRRNDQGRSHGRLLGGCIGRRDLLLRCTLRGLHGGYVAQRPDCGDGERQPDRRLLAGRLRRWCVRIQRAVLRLDGRYPTGPTNRWNGGHALRERLLARCEGRRRFRFR